MTKKERQLDALFGLCQATNMSLHSYVPFQGKINFPHVQFPLATVSLYDNHKIDMQMGDLTDAQVQCGGT
jgi:hypothetical protein